MSALSNRVSIPKWISCHTYFFGKENSRTYIADEKNHVYVQLDGISSDLWKMLYDRADDKTIANFAKQYDAENQVDEFIMMLVEQGLLSLAGEDTIIDERCAPLLDDEQSGEEERAFIEEMQNWMFENGLMYGLFFELTYRCNLKCVHCYNPKHMNSVEIDFDLCKKAIDEAYEVGCFRITFSGGESFLHTRFLELVEYARSKHMSVEIFTNGQLLASNSALYEAIRKLYPYRICVSLYSMDEKMHDSVTAIDGSYQKTYSLINKMKGDNMNVQIKNFLLNFNCMDCIGVKNYASKIGATSVADISLIPTIEGDKKTMQYALSEEELFSLYTNPDSPLYIDKKFKPFDMQNLENSTPCLGGFSSVCVNPNGEVVICVSMPYLLGDLKKESIKDIWLSAMEKKEDSKLYQWHKVTLADCKECFKEDYCAFCNYCPGMGMLENGYLKRSDVLCKQAKAKMSAYYYLQKTRK